MTAWPASNVRPPSDGTAAQCPRAARRIWSSRRSEQLGQRSSSGLASYRRGTVFPLAYNFTPRVILCIHAFEMVVHTIETTPTGSLVASSNPAVVAVQAYAHILTIRSNATPAPSRRARPVLPSYIVTPNSPIPIDGWLSVFLGTEPHRGCCGPWRADE